MNTYARLPIAFTHGEGCWLIDGNGKRYFDTLSSIATCGLGHAHPAIIAAISAQARRVMHTSNLCCITLQEELATQLCQMSGMDAAFFSNSGGEANETAIKLIRQVAHHRQIADPLIVVMSNAFHGRTMATFAASDHPTVRHGFDPLPIGFIRVPYNDCEAISELARTHANIIAVLVEPIQGDGGINIPDPEYLQQLRTLCDQHEWLLALDEVQTGNGRTGTFFAYQNEEIEPDIVTTAKGLGNGMPIGACLARRSIADYFQPGMHGSTFGGNPLACATALAVLRTIEEDQLCMRAQYQGKLLLNALRQHSEDLPHVSKVRGKGLMIGIQLDRPNLVHMEDGLKYGLFINILRNDTIRLLPPLIMTDDEREWMTRQLISLLHQRSP